MFDVTKILNFMKKNFSRRDVILFLLIIILYFGTRVVNLTKLPIFCDEGIYIRWAKTAWHDASWRFISLTDGRQPLHTWGMIPFLKIFTQNPLLAGRLFSVFTGLVSLLMIFSLMFYLFGKKAAFISMLLYIFTPYFLFYDRLALIDSGVNAGFITIFFFSILLGEERRLDVALLLGLLSGVFLLAKSSVKLFVVLSILGLFLTLKKKKNGNKVADVVSFLILYSLSSSIAYVIYNVQRLSPFFHNVADKNKTFVLTFSELLNNPFQVFNRNVILLFKYIMGEIGWITLPFILLGLYWCFLSKKKRKYCIYATSWFVLSYLAIALIAKVVFPRYLIFLGSILIFFLTYFFTYVRNRLLLIVALVLVGASFLYYDYSILFNPSLLPFPKIDRGQYVTGVTAGWGVDDILKTARARSKRKPVIILAEGNFGVVGDMLEALLLPGDRIRVKGYWPFSEKSIRENEKFLKDHYVFVVLPYTHKIPSSWNLEMIKRYKKPASNKELLFLELKK